MSRLSASSKLLAMSLLLWNAQLAEASPDWERYRERFILPEGRVLDTGNGGISHSEGQGFALLLATHAGDRPTFERVWTWTKTHLQKRSDRLFSWKWTPETGISDPNNATDGDLLISWALLRASERWQTPAWRDEALAIADDTLKLLYRETDEHTYLLPGAYGFSHPNGDVLNPSYWVFPAYAAIKSASGRSEWQKLYDSALHVLGVAAFGPWQLPPDWLKLSRPPVPAPNFPARFGYDAVRVPLYLMWAGEEKPLVPFKRYWQSFSGRPVWPAWIDLDRPQAASYHAPSGMRAIARATMAYPRLEVLHLPALDANEDYYSASLLLLTRMMIAERQAP